MYETPESETNGVPRLSPDQMAEDFEYLVKIANEVCPAHALNKAIYGIDIPETLERYRRMLPEVSTTEDFVRLLDRTVKACHASHFFVTSVSKEMLEQLGKHYPGITERSAELSSYYCTSVIRRPWERIKFNPALFYHEGDYYVKHEFAWHDRTYPAGLRVTHYNGKLVDQITENLIEHIFAHWDFHRRRFYHPFFIGVVADDSSEVRLRFEGRDEEDVFPADAEVEIRIPERELKPAVRYFGAHRMLYLRVPTMNPNDIAFYKEGILQESKRGSIERVVLDIRNNGGGSDWVWMAVLSMVLPRQSIGWEGAVTMRNTQMVREYYEKVYGAEKLSQWQPRRIPLLNNEEFIWATEPGRIERAPEAIDFSGMVIVVADYIYSAAGSLAALATKSDCMITVGRRNPHILGMGINPFVFPLPNSQALISVEPILDFANVEKVEDLLHSEVNVEVQPTLEEMLDYYNSPLDPLSPEFLFERDPFMRKLLEISPK